MNQLYSYMTDMACSIPVDSFKRKVTSYKYSYRVAITLSIGVVDGRTLVEGDPPPDEEEVNRNSFVPPLLLDS